MLLVIPVKTGIQNGPWIPNQVGNDLKLTLQRTNSWEAYHLYAVPRSTLEQGFQQLQIHWLAGALGRRWYAQYSSTRPDYRQNLRNSRRSAWFSLEDRGGNGLKDSWVYHAGLVKQSGTIAVFWSLTRQIAWILVSVFLSPTVIAFVILRGLPRQGKGIESPSDASG